MPQVYSTLSNDQKYTLYRKGENDLPEVVAAVVVKGGSNVADKRIVTEIGICTQVSDNELEVLNKNKDFQRHTKNGFITVKKQRVNAEKVAADMNTRDKSAPMRPEDYEEDKAPVVGAPKEK